MKVDKGATRDLLWLAVMLCFLAAVLFVGLRFSASPQPVFTGAYPEADNSAWSLKERLETACHEGRLAAEKCPKAGKVESAPSDKK